MCLGNSTSQGWGCHGSMLMQVAASVGRRAKEENEPVQHADDEGAVDDAR